jgi:DNA-binding response OmpR family regulator
MRAGNKASNGKLFVYDELVARMRAVLRRSNAHGTRV